jgi:hypothetical protein
MGKKISLYFVLVRGLQEYFLFFLSSKGLFASMGFNPAGIIDISRNL